MSGRRALLGGGVALLAVFAAAWWALSAAFHPGALPTASYATRAEAEAKGAFAPVPGGWLPALIPPGATELHETHNPPTHQTWGQFTVPSDGWSPAGAAPHPPGELMLLGPPRNVAWWPALLRGRVASSDLQLLGFRISFIESESSPLVVASKGRQAWFWRLARQ